MPPPVIPFKAGIVLLLGIVSAPALKPLFDKTLKSTVHAGMKMKKAASDATSGLKVLAAEAVQEKYAADADADADDAESEVAAPL